MQLPYILKLNLHPFYSFRGLKNQMQIKITCGLDSRSRPGFWKYDIAAVHALRTIKYNNLLFYLLLMITIYYLAHEPYGPSFTGFKTTSRNVQRCGLLYCLLTKWIITHKQFSLASLLEKCEDCIINFRKSSFLGSSEFPS